MPIKVEQITLGILKANCYVVIDDNTGKAFVVDPGKYDSQLIDALKKYGVKELEYILITHGHFDHITGAAQLKKNFGGKIVVHTLDKPCLSGSFASLSFAIGPFARRCNADIVAEDGDILPFGNSEIKVLHTPGHTVGSVCYLTEDCLFTGDTLFHLLTGKTTYPGGNEADMKRSLKRLYDLQGDYRVFTGHDDMSTLDYERKNNPYMQNI